VSASAVVFGYGDIGVRCTRVLLEHGVDVKLVVTHADDPAENRWYASLAEFATTEPPVSVSFVGASLTLVTLRLKALVKDAPD